MRLINILTALMLALPAVAVRIEQSLIEINAAGYNAAVRITPTNSAYAPADLSAPIVTGPTRIYTPVAGVLTISNLVEGSYTFEQAGKRLTFTVTNSLPTITNSIRELVSAGLVYGVNGPGFPGVVKATPTDTTPAVLGAKLVAGSNITITTNNASGNATLTITGAAAGGSDAITNNDTRAVSFAGGSIALSGGDGANQWSITNVSAVEDEGLNFIGEAGASVARFIWNNNAPGIWAHNFYGLNSGLTNASGQTISTNITDSGTNIIVAGNVEAPNLRWLWQDIPNTSQMLAGAGQGSLNYHTNSVGVGANSLQSSPGGANSALGAYSLQNSPGSYNASLGVDSLRSSAGNNNSSLGAYSLRSSPGNNNSSLGVSSLQNSPGNNNSSLGYYSLRYSPGNYNSSLGTYALYQTTGSYNFAGGYYAGEKLDAGSSNVYLGPFSGPANNTSESNKLYIANAPGTPLIGGDFAAKRIDLNGLAVVTNALLIRSNSAASPPTLSPGDISFVSQEGVPVVVSKDAGGVQTTNRLDGVASGKVLYVDPSGNDSAALNGSAIKPFATLSAAQTAATSGDMVYVRSGSYTNHTLGKDGVNWFFEPGASLSVDTSQYAFSDQTADISYSVRGNLKLTGAGGLFIGAATNSVVSLELDGADFDDRRVLVLSEESNLSIRARVLSSIIIWGGGAIDINADTIKNGALVSWPSRHAYRGSPVPFTIKANRMLGVGFYEDSSARGFTNITQIKCSYWTTPGHVSGDQYGDIHITDGMSQIVGATIVLGNTNGIFINAGSSLILDGCNIVQPFNVTNHVIYSNGGAEVIVNGGLTVSGEIDPTINIAGGIVNRSWVTESEGMLRFVTITNAHIPGVISGNGGSITNVTAKTLISGASITTPTIWSTEDFRTVFDEYGITFFNVNDQVFQVLDLGLGIGPTGSEAFIGVDGAISATSLTIGGSATVASNLVVQGSSTFGTLNVGELNVTNLAASIIDSTNIINGTISSNDIAAGTIGTNLLSQSAYNALVGGGSGVTTNVAVLVPGDLTNTLQFSLGVLTNVVSGVVTN